VKRPIVSSRRSFIKLLAWLGGAAGAMRLSGRYSGREDIRSLDRAQSGKGYRMTPHIRDYYRSVGR
jgi:hypothetical protein